MKTQCVVQFPCISSFVKLTAPAKPPRADPIRQTQLNGLIKLPIGGQARLCSFLPGQTMFDKQHPSSHFSTSNYMQTRDTLDIQVFKPSLNTS